jgi:transcriptional regulator with XRE-family HTH domain
MKLGTKIKQLREMRGFSQQVVADHLQMTQANYHKLESDKSEIRLDYIEKLAEFYKVPITDFLSTDRHVFNIQNNSNNHNVGIITTADKERAELLAKHLAALEEMMAFKNEKIANLEKELASFRKGNDT